MTAETPGTDHTAGNRRTIDRRAFLARGLAFVAVGSAMPAAFVRAVSAEELTGPARAAAGGSDRRALVIVQLGGGNDGLNTLVPYADGSYFDSRGKLAITPETALPLNDRIALNPALAGMRDLYDRGDLAIVEGVGYPDPNRSHFRSMEIWHTASTENSVSTGWLGRLLDVTAGDHDSRWRAANVGASAPLALTAGDSFVPSLESVPAYVLQGDRRLRGSREAEQRLTDWVHIYAQQAAAGGRLALISETGLDAYHSTVDLGEEVDDYVPQVAYSDSPLGKALLTCAQLIGSSIGTNVCYVTTGGFDSHAAQDRSHPRLLSGISDALVAFQDDLRAQGSERDVATFVWTEFGRRVRANGSSGTDHGTASPAFLLGGAVNGGLYGEPSSLDRLDDNGDLRYTTDFRSIYSSVIEQWLGADPVGVLGDRYPQLPLFG